MKIKVNRHTTMSAKYIFQKNISSPHFATFVLLIVISLFFSGCSELTYLPHMVSGHLKLMSTRVKIDKIIQRDESSVKTLYKLDSLQLQRLRLSQQIRDFASEELGLPKNKSYRVYADTKGEHRQWNIVAAPEFSVEPVTWCFPFAGCVVYKGYFSKKKALKQVSKLEEEGYDVYMYEISAYSTLGWFNDPILYNHLRLDEISLAGLIFHEMAHQQLYRKKDSRFNESFAVTVEQEGVKRWLQASGRDSLLETAQRRWQAQEARINQFADARRRLSELYSRFEAVGLAKSINMVSAKQIFERENSDSDIIRSGMAGKDSLMRLIAKELGVDEHEINNAWFITSDTYYSLVPMFKTLLEEQGGNLSKFYETAQSCHLNY